MQFVAVSRVSARGAIGARSTSSRLAQRRERPGGRPVFQNIGAVSAEQRTLTGIVLRRWTDSSTGTRLCAVRRPASVLASVDRVGVGDGTHAKHSIESARVSRAAIAAAIALDDVASGERLVAFALASFANREQLAWPGTSAAAARAGLARSRYLEARGRLLSRGLIETYEPGGGRGRSTTVLLRFVEGPRFDGPVNPELFETALCYSRSSGPGRLLVASIAALADEDRELDGVSADELCAAAGLAPSTYRRARNALIASGELGLVRGLGGRGRPNRWRVADLRSVGQVGMSRPRRRTSATPARPLMTPAAPRPAEVEPSAASDSPCETEPQHAAIEGITTSAKGAQDRTVSAVKGAQDRTVSAGKGAQDRTLSEVKGAQDRTVSAPPRVETQPEREPPNARAWKEPGNHRTVNPPNPPEGGSDADVLLEESYVSDRGRKRTRRVPVDVDAILRKLRAPSAADEAAWRAIRTLMHQAAGESTFGIWLSQLELAAVDLEGLLVLVGPEDTLAWVQNRFDRLISRCCQHAGRSLRFATKAEQLVVRSQPHRLPSAVASDQPTINRRVS
jgi:hypothetical protein